MARGAEENGPFYPCLVSSPMPPTSTPGCPRRGRGGGIGLTEHRDSQHSRRWSTEGPNRSPLLPPRNPRPVFRSVTFTPGTAGLEAGRQPFLWPPRAKCHPDHLLSPQQGSQKAASEHHPLPPLPGFRRYKVPYWKAAGAPWGGMGAALWLGRPRRLEGTEAHLTRLPRWTLHPEASWVGRPPWHRLLERHSHRQSRGPSVARLEPRILAGGHSAC